MAGAPEMASGSDFEFLLRQALSPVEPPARLTRRLEDTLESITELALEELEGWELSAMRDPRDWVRPAAALVVGTGAGVALVLLRARRQSAEAEQHFGAAVTHAATKALRDIELTSKRLRSKL